MTNHPRPEAGDPTDQSPLQTTKKTSPQAFLPTLQRNPLHLEIVQQYEARHYYPNVPPIAGDAMGKTLLVIAQLVSAT